MVERQPGGLVYEVWADGTTIPWGRLLIWELPERFVMWEAVSLGDGVELTFQGVGPAVTWVVVEHRGWEHLSGEQIAAPSRAPGGYDAGWAAIIAPFASVANQVDR